ncbi:MAG: hypothetical protein M1825_002895 [Sarcosagium campestre]|nr:MAG: hypothetical protein M1825_002895 [Sarcosagium campestre]
MPLIAQKRQAGYYSTDGDYWYYSTTAVAIKWGVLAAVVFIIFIFFLLGYLHAQRRLKKGLLPHRYHRWFIPRRQLARIDPRYARPQPHFVYPQQAYGNGYNMQPMAPPAYDPNFAPPPMYMPPAGASKTQPSQPMPGQPGEASGSAATGHQTSGVTAPVPAHTNTTV